MCEVRVIYHSSRGHAEEVAQAVADTAGVSAQDITKPHVLPGADLLLIGAGLESGHEDRLLLDYLDHLPAGAFRGAAVFLSCFSGREAGELLFNVLQHKGIVVYPEICRLKVKRFRLHPHPDRKDLDKVCQWTSRVLADYTG